MENSGMQKKLTKSEITAIIREYSFIRIDQGSIERGGFVMLYNTNDAISHHVSEIDAEEITEEALRQEIEKLRLTKSRLETLLEEEKAELEWFATALFKGIDVEPKSDSGLALLKKLAVNMKEIAQQGVEHYVVDGDSAVSALTNVDNIETLLENQSFD